MYNAQHTLESIIDTKKANALAVVEKVQNQIIEDYLVPTNRLQFSIPQVDAFEANSINVCLADKCETKLHKNAITQIAEKLQIPSLYVKSLLTKNGWGSELLAQNLNTLASHLNNENLLVRTIDKSQTAMAFLSSNYKRIDARPILDSFMKVCTKLGLIPIDGYALDTRVSLRVISPVIYSPFGTSNELEKFVFGLEWKTSDFGCGSNSASKFKLRLTCRNGAVGTNVMREIHYGGNLNNDVEYSAETIRLNTRANLSALLDTVKFYMSERQLEKESLIIQQAHRKELNDAQAKKMLVGMNKTDTDDIIRLYNSPDNINMPQGKTQYRLSNAVSFFAQTDKFSRDKMLELEEKSGLILEAK